MRQSDRLKGSEMIGNNVLMLETLITELRSLRELVEQRLPSSRTDKAFSVADAAKYLGVSESFIRKKIAAGKIQATRQGRRVTIAQSELQRLLTEGILN